MRANFLTAHAAVILSSLSFSASLSAKPEPIDSGSVESVDDVESLLRRSDGRFDVRCQDGRVEIRTSSDLLANNVCVQGGGGGTGGGSSIGFIYGRSDSCSSDSIVAEVRSTTDCNGLSASDSAWSVKRNGVCENISDTNIRGACLYLRTQQPNANIIYGRSDSCGSDSILAMVDATTNCYVLSSTDSAWSVRRNGVCENISDTNARSACLDIKGSLPGASVIYGRSDSCSADSVVAVVDDNTDCNSLSNTDIAWSIRVNGSCQNISDTNVRAACFMARGG